MLLREFAGYLWIHAPEKGRIQLLFSPVCQKMLELTVLYNQILVNYLILISKPLLRSLIKHKGEGHPWWRSGWESACQCRGHGFEPWSGKIPHAADQLGPWATTTEPARLEPVLRNKRGRDSERPAHRDEEWSPLSATGESPRTETKTQHSQKKKKNQLCFNKQNLKKKNIRGK